MLIMRFVMRKDLLLTSARVNNDGGRQQNLAINQSISHSVNQSVIQSINQSINQSQSQSLFS